MLELERLSKTYADGTHALADVTLEVRESEIVSVVGGSGCGSGFPTGAWSRRRR